MFTTQARPSVSSVAASLVAYEQNVREAIATLELIYPGLVVDGVELRFRRAGSDSPLKEVIDGLITLSYQTDVGRQIPVVIEHLTGHKVSRDTGAVIEIVVLALTTYGLYWATDKVFGRKKPDAAPIILGDFNTIVQAGGDVLVAEPALLDQAVRARFQSEAQARTLSKRAIQLVRPAAAERGAGLQAGGAELSSEAIRAAPTMLDFVTEDEEDLISEHQDQTVVIHATDLDSNKTGWAGHLPGLWEKRLKMRLYPTVRRDEVFGKAQFRADLILVRKATDEGKSIPFLFHVVRILPD